MSLSTYYLEYGRHIGQLHRRRRCAYPPMSNTDSHDNHEKINSWVSFSILYEYGAPLGGPLGRRSSAIIFWNQMSITTFSKSVCAVLMVQNIYHTVPRWKVMVSGSISSLANLEISSGVSSVGSVLSMPSF